MKVKKIWFLKRDSYASTLCLLFLPHLFVDSRICPVSVLHTPCLLNHWFLRDARFMQV